MRRARVRRRAPGRARARRSPPPTRTSSPRPGTGRSRASTLPVYYHWEFATGSGGDFETLARLLTAAAGRGDVGRRPLRVGDAAVRAARRRRARSSRARSSRRGAPAPPAPTAAFRNALRKLVNLAAASRSSRRRSTAAGRPRSRPCPPTPRRRAWLRELNLDPAARAVAGLGVARRAGAAGAARRGRLGPARRRRRAVRAARAAARGRASRCSARSCAAASQPMDAGRLVQFLGPAQRAHAHVARDARTPRSRGRACRRRSARPPFRRVVTPVAPSKVGFAARAAAVPGDREPARHGRCRCSASAAAARPGSSPRHGDDARP